MNTLYFSKGACSLAPHILLLEAGLKFKLEAVNLKTKEFSGGDYRQVNPKGSVPALRLENGEVLTEGPAIDQWIAAQNPEKGLMPKTGTFEYSRAQEWLNYVSSEIHKTFTALISAKRWVTNPEGQAQLEESVKKALHAKFEFLDKHFAKNKFLLGDHFTAPDAYLFVVTKWGDKWGVDYSGFKNLSRFIKDVGARPKVAEAIQAET